MLSYIVKRPIGQIFRPGLIRAKPAISTLFQKSNFQSHLHLRRNFHSTINNPIKFNSYSSSNPRFNRGPLTSTSLLFSLIPDGLKAIFTVLGVSAFILFFAGPLLIITVPPLIAGGYVWSRIRLARREKAMNQRWQDLLETHLTYKGSELDQARLEAFVIKRVLDAFRQDEQGIIEQLGLSKEQQYHVLESRFELGPVETIDQDFQISRTTGIKEHITVMSFGLHDLDSASNLSRVATVIVTLRPRSTITTMLDVNTVIQDAIIEVKPLLQFKKPVTLRSESQFKEPPSLNIRAKR